MADSVSTETLTQLYREMLLIRRFEEKVSTLFASGRMPGFTHSYIGMEAVAAGMCHGLRPTDKITSTHRGHGHAIAKGLDLSGLMAELYGKSTGVCRGRGGSMHFADVELGLIGGNGIVAGGLPMATGLALAHKKDGGDSVVVAFFGEGGVNQGTFHESLNLAGIWTLPIVYVIENNLYTEYIHYRAITAIEQLSDRAASYGFPGVTVDGQDVVAVYQAAETAISRARAGDGATLLEMRTFRFRGHHEGEEQILGVNVYRSLEEIEKERQERDPLELAKQRLLEAGVTEGVLADLAHEIEKSLDAAVEFAESSELPGGSEAMEDIYAAPFPD